MEQRGPQRGASPEALTTGRSVAMGTHGAVASSHYLASQTGFEVLKRGGHAVEAAIAMNAVLAVVYNHMAGLGGDLFYQIWDQKTAKVEALNGSGRSGEAVTRDAYASHGVKEIPQRGPLAANTVPGVVDAWWQMHQRYGKLPWASLFESAISFAEDGYPISQKFRDYIVQYTDILKEYEATARILLPEGQPPAAGQVVLQRDLARSFHQIAESGTEAFYRGDLAQRIVRSLRESGGFLSETDFTEHTSDWVEPIQTTYRGYTVSELPPNTQGLTTLVLLNLIEPFDLHELADNTADYYHLLAEATKLAFIPRDRWVTDPAFLEIPLKEIISKGYADTLRRFVDMKQARNEQDIRQQVGTPGGDDTTYMCAVDSEGNCCSLIQSVYFEFGSAFTPEGTGIFLQNRGSFFKLDPEHPNTLEPRKRTFHTIIPAMALMDDRPFLLFGTMGGEGQPQTQAAILTRIVDFGYTIQQAIESPRWLYGRTWGQESLSLKLEGRIPDGVAGELKRRKHEVEIVEDWSQKMGHAQGIVIDQDTGVLSAGADPRGDGVALCW